MKKLFVNPVANVVFALIFILIGVLIGRYNTNTVIRLKENEQTGRTYQEEMEETTPELPVIDNKIDINTATADIFAMLPGIGETLADRIIAYRDENGPYQSVEELLNVEGIGEKKLNAIRSYLTVG